jgi:hypothetical protein
MCCAGTIRTATPGLYVFKGGVLIPRWYWSVRQNDFYRMTSNRLSLDFTFTPTPHLLVGAEAPVEFRSGGHALFANAPVWGKYRFFRRLREWGDSQAAAQYTLALPTGMVDPNLRSLPIVSSAQLQPGARAWESTLELTGSLAYHRTAFAADIAHSIAPARAGFAPGAVTHVAGALEYILLPRPSRYHHPTHELWAVIEPSFESIGQSHLNGNSLTTTGGKAAYVAAGLQYVPSPRLSFSISWSIPAWRSTRREQFYSPRNLWTEGGILY